nr:Chain C, 10-mer peptide [synthetic construct]
LTTKLTNTNI